MAKTYTSISTFTSGAILTAAQMNQIGTTLNNNTIPSMVRLNGPAGTSYTGGADVSWNTTPSYDTDTMFSSGSPTRITIGTAGIYLVVAHFRPTFTGTVTNSEARISVDGSVDTINAVSGVSNSLGGLYQQVTLTKSFTAAQYLTASIVLTGASTANMGATSWFSATWLGKAS